MAYTVRVCAAEAVRVSPVCAFQAVKGQDSLQQGSSTAGIIGLPAASDDGQAAMARQWRPPGPNDTELSTVQSYFTLPQRQRGRTPYFELSNVRLQNRTIWVYTGELLRPLCLPASQAIQVSLSELRRRARVLSTPLLPAHPYPR